MRFSGSRNWPRRHDPKAGREGQFPDEPLAGQSREEALKVTHADCPNSWNLRRSAAVREAGCLTLFSEGNHPTWVHIGCRQATRPQPG